MSASAKVLAQLRRLDWARGLRSGIAVAVSMIVCRILHLPMGWSALGAFEGNIVDNGGPYRVRFASIALLMAGGGLGVILAGLASPHLVPALLLTAVVAFAVTFLRAAGPPFTNTSVIILVVYFVGIDHPTAAVAAALQQAGLFLGGCACAGVISLFLWPLYPFRHARFAIAACYGVLAQSLTQIDAALTALDPPSDAWRAEWFALVHVFPQRMRKALEAARSGLGGVRARTTARGLQGRNLAVLLETADILFGRSLAVIDFAERSVREGGPEDTAATSQRLRWLAQATDDVQQELLRHVPERVVLPAPAEAGTLFAPALHALDVECMQSLENARDAADSVWTGVDRAVPTRAEQRLRKLSPVTLELLRQNWSFDSSIMRHALRTAAVCVASILLVRALHVPYGEWMALTAVIVLQPYVAHTWRKSLQRVGGTVAGGLLAALLAQFIRTPEKLIVTVSITAFFTLAWYTANYAWYCFFLTPTFVLLTIRGPHGWDIAGIRAMDTFLGAALALIAVKLLWTESEHLRMGSILARSAAANAAYLAALRLYWKAAPGERAEVERDVLSVARRHVGLANNESEEALERLMMESTPPPERAIKAEHALAFATYSRRLTQSVTTVAILHPTPPNPLWEAFVDELRSRLERTAALLRGQEAAPDQPRAMPPPDEPQGQGVRLRRQVEVLEKSALAAVQGYL
jgi:uncharacterized membrane protein YccC